MILFENKNIWVRVKDGNPIAMDLFQRHYSKYHYKDGRRPKIFVGPGEKVVLINNEGTALFVWRKFKDKSGQVGINCSIFRNESKELSSKLILEAEKVAFEVWGEQRYYTYVNAEKIKSTNPGYCFKQAGWKVVGVTKVNRLIILAKDRYQRPEPSTGATQLAASTHPTPANPPHPRQHTTPPPTHPPTHPAITPTGGGRAKVLPPPTHPPHPSALDLPTTGIRAPNAATCDATDDQPEPCRRLHNRDTPGAPPGAPAGPGDGKVLPPPPHPPHPQGRSPTPPHPPFVPAPGITHLCEIKNFRKNIIVK
jgi:hypothetical protein